MEGDPRQGVEDHPAGHHNEYEGIPVAEEYDYAPPEGELASVSTHRMPRRMGSRPEVPEADPGFLHSLSFFPSA